MDHAQQQSHMQTDEVASIFTRHKFELKRRELTITAKEFVTPKMIRITVSGDDLADFPSMAPDDHLKLMINNGTDKPDMRDYTPRYIDNKSRVLVVDFAIHEAGPATQWAINAEIGDKMRIGGPRGSSQLTEAFDWKLLIGDETALPAMGRWVEESSTDHTLLTLGIVTGKSEEQHWQTNANHAAYWVHRPSSDDTNAHAVIEQLRTLELPSGKGFIWIAAEAKAAREIKAFVLQHFAHPPQFVKSSGYWVKGQADSAEK